MKIFAANAIDAYKYAHPYMVPSETNYVSSNFTPRTMRLYTGNSSKVVVIGHQGFIQWYLKDLWDETFFNVRKERAVKRFKRRADQVIGKNRVNIKHIEALHDLGYMPIEVRAIDEGEMVNPQVPTYVINNTVDEMYWLPGFLESGMSSELWKTYVAATTAKDFLRICEEFSAATCDNDFHIPFQCHDFSFRGMSGMHDNASTGIGHLSCFVGTDSILPIDYIEDYYGDDGDKTLIGCSVAATEHYVTTLSIADILVEMEEHKEWVDKLWRNPLQRIVDEVEGENSEPVDDKLIAELIYQYRLINRFNEGVLSIVMDSYDFWSVVKYNLRLLKPYIRGRKADSNGLAKVVVRPDSGDPVKVLTGYKVFDVTDGIYANCVTGLSKSSICEWVVNTFGNEYEVIRMNGLYWKIDDWNEQVPEHEVKGLVVLLDEIFGSTLNEKGYRVLSPEIGAIYGDSITLDRAEQIMSRLADKGYASSNVVLGIGSYTYNYCTRDTLGLAMKATYGEVNGQPRDVFKQPKTDSGKNSAKGRLAVFKDENGEFIAKQGASKEEYENCELKLRFKDGVLYNKTSFEEVRNRLKKY